MMRLTLAIVGKSLFDTETEAEAEQIRQAVSESMKRFNRFMLPFIGFLDRLPLPANRDFKRARSHLDSIIYRIIDERRRSAELHQRIPMGQRFVASRDARIEEL